MYWIHRQESVYAVLLLNCIYVLISTKAYEHMRYGEKKSDKTDMQMMLYIARSKTRPFERTEQWNASPQEKLGDCALENVMILIRLCFLF